MLGIKLKNQLKQGVGITKKQIIMKKLLFITVLLMSITGLRAQEFHFGARLGGNFTTLSVSGDNSDWAKNSKGKPGFSIGAVSEFMLNDQFAIGVELNYATAGDAYSFFDGELKVTEYLSYIQIPVMAKYYINENFYLNAGPQLGFLSSAEEQINFMGADAPEDKLKDVKKKYESTDFGLNIGAGYKFENGLFLDLRYTAGMSDIYKDKDTTKKNNAVMFSVGYFFN